MNLTLCAPQTLSLSPDNKNLLLTGGLVINLKTENSNQLATNTLTAGIQWSKDGSQVLLNGSLISLDGGQTKYNLNTLGKEATNFYWDETNKKIYYQSGGNISCIATDKNTISTILSGSDYSAYIVYDKLIYTIEKQANKYYLRVYDVDSNLLQSSTDLPVGDYRFQVDNYHLNLYDRKQQALYLLSNYAQQPIIKQMRPVLAWQWLNDNYLVWNNEFEIYSLDSAANRQDLLIRVSEPVTGTAWYKAKNYLIYASDKQINIINLSLDKKIPITLLDAELISNFALDEKNQLLYFYAKIGQQAGIYKLQLQ